MSTCGMMWNAYVFEVGEKLCHCLPLTFCKGWFVEAILLPPCDCQHKSCLSSISLPVQQEERVFPIFGTVPKDVFERQSEASRYVGDEWLNQQDAVCKAETEVR